MIVLTEREDMKKSSWCIVCVAKAGTADLMVCDQCRGYRFTTYTCPDCGIENQFNGYDIPDFCTCGYYWPDINFLKESIEARVEFHWEMN